MNIRIEFVKKHATLSDKEIKFLNKVNRDPFLIKLIKLARNNASLVTAIKQYCAFYPEDINKCGEYNASSLSWAIGFNIDIVLLLLQEGANINHQNIFGNTALHILKHNVNNAKILLEYDLNINIVNSESKVPLDLCSVKYKGILNEMINNITMLNVLV